MASAQNKTARGTAYLLVTALIFGSSFFIVKTSVDLIPPCWLIGIRFSLAAVLLGAVFCRRLRAMNVRTLGGGVVIGLFLCAAYIAQTVGIMGTTPGRNAFLTALYVVVVPFLNWIVTRVRPDRFSIAAAVVCTAGIACISLDGTLSMSTGDALSVLCGVLFAAQIVTIAYFEHRGLDPILLTIIQLAVAGIGALAVAAWAEPVPQLETPSLWMSLLYLSVVVSGVAFLLQNVGQSLVRPSLASILLSLEAVFGVLFSVLFYGEQLTVRVTTGFVLVFVAIVISETKLTFLRRKPNDA